MQVGILLFERRGNYPPILRSKGVVPRDERKDSYAAVVRSRRWNDLDNRDDSKESGGQDGWRQAVDEERRRIPEKGLNKCYGMNSTENGVRHAEGGDGAQRGLEEERDVRRGVQEGLKEALLGMKPKKTGYWSLRPTTGFLQSGYHREQRG